MMPAYLIDSERSTSHARRCDYHVHVTSTDSDTSQTDSDAVLDATRSRIVLEAMRDEQTDRFDSLVDEIGVERVIELGATEHGAAWAATPPYLLGDDYRLVILHSTSRLFRFDGDAMHLDGTLFEAMVASLQNDDDSWAEHASRPWRQLVMHAGESRAALPQAMALLERFPMLVRSNPGLLGSIATLASTCGDPIAGELWDQVLEHPRLGDDAALRCELELEWARCHLLLGGGEPARAVVVLQRVRKGLGDLTSAQARLRWTDATLELISALTWIGRPADSLQLLEDSLRQVEPGGELETWIHGIGAYPAAAVGDIETMRVAIAAIARAATDTSSLEIRAIVPARLLIAAREQDTAGLHATIASARALESGRPLDLEARAAWRVHAAECSVELDQHALAWDLLGDLDRLMSTSPIDLPIHRLRRDLVALQLAADRGQLDDTDLRRQAELLGITLPQPGAHQIATVPACSADAALEIRLLGTFEVLIDASLIDDQLWSGRRQARMLLALLLVNDGRIPIDDVADALWRDIDLPTATARIAPLCNAIRSVLAAAGAADPPRELVTRGGSLMLRLHERDRCDLHELRRTAERVRQEPARTRELALAAITSLEHRPILDLGTDGAAAMLRDAIERELIDLIPQLAAAWDGHAAPDRVVDAVRRAFDMDPSNAATCARLMRMLADRGEPAAASAVFHRTRTELRSDVGLEPPTDLVRLHATIIADDPVRIDADSPR
jgi:DNA-binding SARP family transcriptional activator